MNILKNDKNNLVLKMSNCSLAYDKKKYIFQNLNLEIYKGERLCILGKNGSGKTSLVESIIGSKKDFIGKVYKPKNLKISFVLQEISFYSTIKDLYEKYIYFLNLENRLSEWLEFFEISDCKNRMYKELSGGQKQKVKLMLAFLRKPDLIIIDEVTTSLDYIWRFKIINDIKKLLDSYPQISLILISHEEKEIANLCSKFVLLKNGFLSEKKEFNKKNKLNDVINKLENL